MPASFVNRSLRKLVKRIAILILRRSDGIAQSDLHRFGNDLLKKLMIELPRRISGYACRIATGLGAIASLVALAKTR